MHFKINTNLVASTAQHNTPVIHQCDHYTTTSVHLRFLNNFCFASMLPDWMIKESTACRKMALRFSVYLDESLKMITASLIHISARNEIVTPLSGAVCVF